MAKPEKQNKKQEKIVPEKERMDAAKKIVAHLGIGSTVAQTVQVFLLIAEDAEESDLVNLTSELVAVKAGLGDSATFEQVLAVHNALVEDEEGLLLEDADEIEEQIEEARETLIESFGDEAAKQPENLVAILGA